MHWSAPCSLRATECTASARPINYLSTMRSMFGSSPYILQVTFNDSSCSIFRSAYAVPATGNCEGSSNESTEFYIVATLDVDGETSIQYFNDSRCSADSYVWTDYTRASMLSSHSCDGNKFQWYSSAEDLSASGSASAASDSTSDSSNGSI
ncbi:hypothetical protein V7S43_005096 [Phytophthora oleae]|uniref:TKL protein kinase n=1 Tax=Phytophthora oleae TaxID=2107226 RepID=A0ABD3FVE9_9STRA